LKQKGTVTTARLAGLLCAFFALAAAAAAPPLKVALTFDDLPLNGTQPAGVSQSQMTRDTLAVFRKYRIPPSYGFIVARGLENNPDGALALQLWVKAGHPLANHTYSHPNLDRITAEDFTREILRNEPVLELLMPPGGLALPLPPAVRPITIWAQCVLLEPTRITTSNGFVVAAY
jgi:peptidoglycan/xylan/chitin deacetylase (PgdA/CDA1 family)